MIVSGGLSSVRNKEKEEQENLKINCYAEDTTGGAYTAPKQNMPFKFLFIQNHFNPAMCNVDPKPRHCCLINLQLGVIRTNTKVAGSNWPSLANLSVVTSVISGLGSGEIIAELITAQLGF